MKMIVSHHQTMNVVRGGVILTAATLFSWAPAFGADLLDAPGPGYRTQSGQPLHRNDLLDVLPAKKSMMADPAQVLDRLKKLHPEMIWQSPDQDYDRLGSEMKSAAGILPDLPRENVFAKPIWLFDVPRAKAPETERLRPAPLENFRLDLPRTPLLNPVYTPSSF